MAGSDVAVVEIGGVRIRTWKMYRIDSDILQPADSFNFKATLPSDREVRAQVREAMQEGAKVRVYVGDDITGQRRGEYLQLAGIAETRNINMEAKGSGTEIDLSGRDRALHLVDSSAPLDLLEGEGTTLTDVAKRAVSPWDIKVVAQAEASRDIRTGERRWTKSERQQIEEARAFGIPPSMYSRQLSRQAESSGKSITQIAGVEPSESARKAYANDLTRGDIEELTTREARPQPGETVWDYLDRHAKRFGLLMWFSPTGELVLSSPRYRQPAKYRFVRREKNRPDDPNTILSGGETRDTANRYSEVTVLGRGAAKGARRAGIRATVKDETMPHYKPFLVHDSSIRSEEEAERRAKRELYRFKANAQVLEYTLTGHGQGHWLYAVDTIAAVDDEVAGVKGPFYMTKRTFQKSKNSGTTTRVRLVPPGSIVL